MNKIYQMRALFPLFLAGLCLGTCTNCNGPKETARTAACPDVDSGLIMRDPNQFAWQVFAKVTESAGATTEAESNSAEAPKNEPAGWESWVSAFRLFADPNGYQFSDEVLASGPVGESSQLVLIPPKYKLNFKPGPSDDKSPIDPTFDDVRLNPAAEKYVIDNKLLSEDGQEDMVKAHHAIDFPPDAIEVKARWRRLTGDRTVNENNYYTKTDRFGIKWGLIALHITTKDIPNWFWATFEQESNYSGAFQFVSDDTWGFDAKGMTDHLQALLAKHHIDPEVWKHYRLGGAQVDFTDSTGKATILGNNQIEGLQSGTARNDSSCMTCHARSVVGLSADGTGPKLPFQMVPGMTGTPPMCWFYTKDAHDRPRQTTFQRDFVWALARAKPRGNLPKVAPVGIFWLITRDRTVYFRDDILPLFRDADVDAVKQKYGFDMSNYNEIVKGDNAQKVCDCYTGKDELKLPVGKRAQPWSQYLKDEYAQWMKETGSAGGPPPYQKADKPSASGDH